MHLSHNVYQLMAEYEPTVGILTMDKITTYGWLMFGSKNAGERDL